MAAPQSTPLPPAPQRNEPESQFVAKSNTFVAALEPHRQELQAQADFVDQSVNAAEAAAQTALATGNYKGLWSSLSGPYSAGISVEHNDTFWALRSNASNIEAIEPGVSAEWISISRENLGTAATKDVATNAEALAGTAGVLPDAGGVHAAIRGLAVGTVSQSGGVPTGAIIERGSNANGEFVKYADGTLICTHSFVFTASAPETVGGSLFRTGHEGPFDFPVAFISTPQVFFTLENNGTVFTHWMGDSRATSGTQYRIELIGTSETTPSDMTVRMFAIRNWY